MTTLYIRDVPPDVTETLKARAAAEGKSLSTYVSAELAKIASRRTNAEIVLELRSLVRTDAPTPEEIVAALHEGRRER